MGIPLRIVPAVVVLFPVQGVPFSRFVVIGHIHPVPLHQVVGVKQNLGNLDFFKVQFAGEETSHFQRFHS